VKPLNGNTNISSFYGNSCWLIRKGLLKSDRIRIHRTKLNFCINGRYHPKTHISNPMINIESDVSDPYHNDSTIVMR
jgi:hypothetical protein